MTPTREQVAQHVRDAGVPDILNRWLPGAAERFDKARTAIVPVVNLVPLTKAAAVTNEESIVKMEADRRWRNWVAGRDKKSGKVLLRRPRITTYMKQVRQERRKQERELMKKIQPPKAGGKAEQVKALRERRATSARTSTAKPTGQPKPQPKQTAEASSQESPMTTTASKATKPKATKPAKSKSTARRKPGTKKASTAARGGTPKVKQPRGMVVNILKLASRQNGVTPAELNALTKWKGAPWKWLFSNPKKTGYCDRFGYAFEVLDRDGATAYKATKK